MTRKNPIKVEKRKKLCALNARRQDITQMSARRTPKTSMKGSKMLIMDEDQKILYGTPQATLLMCNIIQHITGVGFQNQ